MRKIVLMLFFLLALASTTFAATLYTCTDLDGNPIITSNPQDGMTKCVPKDFSADMTFQKKDQQQGYDLQINPNSDNQPSPDEHPGNQVGISSSSKRGADNPDNELNERGRNTGDGLPVSSSRSPSEPYRNSIAAPVNIPPASSVETVNIPASSAEMPKKRKSGGYRPPPSDSAKDASTSSSLR